MKPKHPPGPPMALGNMRHLGDYFVRIALAIGVACGATYVHGAPKVSDATVKRLIAVNTDLNVMCRGGGPDLELTKAACEAKAKNENLLENLHYCFAKKGQDRAQMRWHKCIAGISLYLNGYVVEGE